MKIAQMLVLSFVFSCVTPAAMACAVCGGASDSPMAKGMNFGIFSLLAVILFMLSLIATFFIYLARKSAHLATTSAASLSNEQTLKHESVS